VQRTRTAGFAWTTFHNRLLRSDGRAKPLATRLQQRVRDPELHRRVCEEIAGFAAALGLTPIMQCDSPISGADGNREFFIGARLG
jgi:hypothetical protein